MIYTIKFWNANAWHLFDEYGATCRDEVEAYARRLALLFIAVEIHTVSPCGEYAIERV